MDEIRKLLDLNWAADLYPDAAAIAGKLMLVGGVTGVVAEGGNLFWKVQITFAESVLLVVAGTFLVTAGATYSLARRLVILQQERFIRQLGDAIRVELQRELEGR